MTVNYTTNLSLGQPVTGTESGTWGDDVNNSITSYLDIAIAGGLSVTVTTTDVTLSITQGTSSATNIGSTTAQYAILNVSGAMTAARNLIVPSSSRIYLINNNTTGGFALTVKGSATSGVTLVNGEKAHVFWNGTDYAKMSNASGGAGSFSSITDSGNLTFTGTGNRILGDFSNTTVASRVQLQSSTTNGQTGVIAIPNGTSTAVQFEANSDSSGGTNASIASMAITATDARFSSGLRGTGTYLPLTFYTSGSEKLRIAADATGTYTFGGTAPRITGDFSNATIASRVMFQTSTTNAQTGIMAIPNGTGTTAQFEVNSDSTGGTNASVGQLALATTDVRIVSSIRGTGTYLPLTFYTNLSEKLRIGADTTGTITIGGTAPRITGDFSNATIASRVMMQSSTVNGATVVGVIPNGTATNAQLQLYNASDATNSSMLQLASLASAVGIYSNINGTGTYLPMTFFTGGSERMRVDTSGKVLINLAASKTYGNNLQVVNSINAIGISSAGSSEVVAYDSNAVDASPTYSSSILRKYGSTTTGNLYFASTIASAGWAEIGGINVQGGVAFGANGAVPLVFANSEERMRIDASGNVGIGTFVTAGNTLRYLDVQNTNTGASAGAIMRLITSNAAASGTTSVDIIKYKTGGFYINNNDTNAAVFTAFQVGASERMRIDSSGNVGIGVVPSAWSLIKPVQVVNAALGAYSNNLYLTANTFFDGSGWRYIATDYACRYEQSYGRHVWYSAPSGTAGTALTFTESMRIDSSGNVGIAVVPNTWTAAWRVIELATSGSSVFSNGSSSVGLGQGFYNNSGSKYAQASYAVGGYQINAGSHQFLIAAAGTVDAAVSFTTAMTLNNSGNLLVGATSAAGKATFTETGTQNTLVAENATFDYYTIVSHNKATSGDNRFVVFGTEASLTARGSITYNRAGGLTVYNTTSDYRAKDIYGPIADSGTLIDSVPVYMGKMKYATQERPMFIAHETPAYAHTGEKDAVDKDGNPVYQQMDASALIPVMWAEIQSLRKRLADAGIS